MRVMKVLILTMGRTRAIFLSLPKLSEKFGKFVSRVLLKGLVISVVPMQSPPLKATL